MSIEVVVPVHNGSAFLSECIQSIRRCSHLPHRIILIDDASTDSATLTLLERFSEEKDIVILKQESNQGFVAAANRGMQHASDSDIILLNSDTVVTDNWMTKLHQCATSRPHVATASPLTSYGSIFAVPEPNQFNPLSAGFSIDEMGKLVENLSRREYPEVPTTNGFCMYIKRQVLDQIGFFDLEAFGRGYGEENDFCMRAKENGWIHLADDATYVFHHGKASFGQENEELRKTNRAKIDARYPYYTALVRDFIQCDPLGPLRRRIRRAMGPGSNADNRKPLRRILFVLHRGAGGTIHTNQDLIAGLGYECDCYELKSDRRHLSLLHHLPDGTVEERFFMLQRPIEVFDYWVDEYRQILLWILKNLQIDLVHIRHLMAHPFDAVELAEELGIPLVLSFHDCYFICPTIHLIDNRGRYCAGKCNGDETDCEFNAGWFKKIPRLKGRFLPAWRAQVERLFEKVDAFVTTSAYTRDLHVGHYPVLEKKSFHIIEHGRDFDIPEKIPATLSRPARLVVFGALNDIKGLALLDKVASMADTSLMEFHCLGTISHPVSKAVHCHGPYKREELPGILRELAPSLALVLSLWPETYCHTLTEAWALGLPVAVSDIGALQERMLSTEGGWLLKLGPPEKVYEQLVQVVSDQEEYQRAVEKVSMIRFKSIEEMAEDYRALYSQLTKASSAEGTDPPENLLTAQETALKAEQRYHLDLLEGRQIKLLRSLEKHFIHAVDNFIKPTLKKNEITYRLGRFIRNTFRKVTGE